MTPEQIAEERRRGRIAGLAAIGAAAAFAGGGVWYQSINSDAPDGNNPALLRFFDRHSGQLIAASALQAIGMALMVLVALHLYRATKARKPDESNVVRVMGIYGPLAFATSTLVRGIALSVMASDFAGRQFQTIDAADDVFKSPVLILTTVLGFSGVIALGYWLVKGCLDAMRVGLLNRFMGVVGVAIGPALVLGFGSLILPVWLLALGVLYLGFWPTGMPRAWEEGRAITPSGRANEVEAPVVDSLDGATRNGEVEAVGPGVRGPESKEGAVGEAAGQSRRKRKRRGLNEG